MLSIFSNYQYVLLVVVIKLQVTSIYFGFLIFLLLLPLFCHWRSSKIVTRNNGRGSHLPKGFWNEQWTIDHEITLCIRRIIAWHVTNVNSVLIFLKYIQKFEQWTLVSNNIFKSEIGMGPERALVWGDRKIHRSGLLERWILGCLRRCFLQRLVEAAIGWKCFLQNDVVLLSFFFSFSFRTIACKGQGLIDLEFFFQIKT